ncbi:retrovirus-related pol polyprotein from transposon TNT 1-94, partial [Tanacetum coccineum]
AQRDKDMQKNLTLITKYFKKIYKPTNNNLRTSLNSRNKNVDTSLRYTNDNQIRQFGNQRTVTVVGARETVCSQELSTADSGTDTKPLEQDDSNVTPDSPDMCDNDIQTDQNVEDERVALANLKLDVDENKKIQNQLKKANTSLAHELKECKSILAETNQAWVKHSKDHFRAPTAHDMEILIKTCLMPLALKTQNDSFTFVHELKQEMHADLKYIESLKKEIDKLESDKAQFSNMYDMLLQECVSNDVMCSYLHSLSDLDAHTELQCLYLHKVKECVCLTQKLSKQTEFFVKPSVVRQLNVQRIPKPSVLGKPTPFSDSLEKKKFSKTKSVPKTNVSEGLSKPVTTQNLLQTARQAVRNKNVIKPGMYQIDTRTTQTRAPQFPQTYRNTNPRASTSTGVTHRTNVSRPPPRSNQMKDNVMLNTSQLKFKKTEVEDHHRISSISNKTKSVTACNDSLKSRTSNVNVVYATCGKCVFNLNHDACVYKFLNDVNTRTKKPNIVPIMSKAKISSFKTKVVPSSKGRLNLLYMDLCDPMRVVGINGKKYILVIIDDYSRYTWTLFLRSKDETPEVLKDFLTMIQRNLQALVISIRTDRGTEFLNKTLNAFFKEEGIEHQTSTPRTPEQNSVVKRRNRTLVEDVRTMLSASKLPLFFWAKSIATACYTQNRSIIIPTYEKMAYHIINDRKPLIKHLHIFGCTCYLTIDGENLDRKKKGIRAFWPRSPMTKGTSSVNNSSSPTDNSKQQDTPPIMNIQSLIEPTNLTNVNTEENNDNEAEDTQFHQDEFINPFCTPIREIAESSSRNIDNSNMHTFYQPHDSEYRWTKDHPLEQVRGNPSKPVQTRRQLATDPEMCMFALTVSTAEPKTIKEAMANSAWIEAMQEELHQIDRL